jgi:hypothetical protein
MKGCQMTDHYRRMIYGHSSKLSENELAQLRSDTLQSVNMEIYPKGLITTWRCSDGRPVVELMVRDETEQIVAVVAIKFTERGCEVEYSAVDLNKIPLPTVLDMSRRN